MSVVAPSHWELLQRAVYDQIIRDLGRRAPDLIIQCSAHIFKWVKDNWASIQNWLVTTGNKVLSIGQKVFDMAMKWVEDTWRSAKDIVAPYRQQPSMQQRPQVMRSITNVGKQLTSP